MVYTELIKTSIRNDLCGILNVDKPPGPTSHDVVATIRRMARQRKVGHAGTLDPMATGVLLVCLGQATRITEYLMQRPKTYRAAVLLGVSTTTHDAEGEITHEAQVNAGRDQVDAALQQFVGRIDQVPPKYSAIKHHGKRMYELARRGIDVQVPAREVDVHHLRMIRWESPTVHIEVRCGPGTYIRALARDLGAALGCGAHLTALRRLSSGSFDVSNAVDLDRLGKAFDGDQATQFLYPIDTALAHLPVLRLSLDMARRLAMGQQVPGTPEGDGSTLCRAYAPGGRFVALVHRDQHTGKWRPAKVFAHPQEFMPLERDHRSCTS